MSRIRWDSSFEGVGLRAARVQARVLRGQRSVRSVHREALESWGSRRSLPTKLAWKEDLEGEESGSDNV
jgi:hypothetical protein